MNQPNQPNQKMALVQQVKQNLIQPLQSKALELMPSNLPMEEKAKIFKCFYLAFDKNPDLAQCTPNSIQKAIMDCAETGLYPNTFHKHGDLIKYGNECQFQPQYFGLVHMARASGNFKSIKIGEICPNDKLFTEEGFDTVFKIEKNYIDPGGQPYAYYAAYETVNGDKDFRIWSRQKCEEHGRRHSKSYHKAWTTSFDEMAKKTVLKNLLKLAPKTDSMAKILDEKDYDDEYDEQQDTIQIIPEGKIHRTQSGLSSQGIQDLVKPSTPADKPEEEKKNNVIRRRGRGRPPKRVSQDPLEKMPDNHNSGTPNILKDDELTMDLPDEFIEDIEKEEPKNILLSKDDHIRQNKEIYDSIDKYLTFPNIKSNQKITNFLETLKDFRLENSDYTILIGAIRAATQKNFQPIESLFRLKKPF